MIKLTAHLTAKDHKSHVPLEFDIPAGTTRIIGTFKYEPKRAQNALFDHLISLSIFGPNGARGARHNNADMNFVIDAADATPGYVAGAIEPGRWTVFLDTFRLQGPDPVTCELYIAFESVAISTPHPLSSIQAEIKGPAWYRGDLHAHSWHSDASWDIPDLVKWAKSRKLDFVTLSDHNTVSGHTEVLRLTDNDLLTMGGVELTTHNGHALSLGGRDWQEWRVGPISGKSMPMIANDVMQRNNIFVIAHPMAPGDPSCTGCRWEFDDMMPGPAKLIEVWNGGVWSDYNEESLKLYYKWLRAGHQLLVTAGTDHHGEPDTGAQFGFNHVWAEARTEQAILDAVRSGKNYLSSGPKLILTIEDEAGNRIAMGGIAKNAKIANIEWTSDQEPLTLKVLNKSGIVAEKKLPKLSSGKHELPNIGVGFVIAELRDSNGLLHTITNPVFIHAL